jgi:hypothetical protein
MVYSLKAVPAALQVTVVLQSCNKSGDKSWKKKGQDDNYNKQNTQVVICRYHTSGDL